MPVTFKNRESNEVHKAYVLVFSRIRMQYVLLRAQCLYSHIVVFANTMHMYLHRLGDFPDHFVVFDSTRSICVMYWCEMIHTCSRCTVNSEHTAYKYAQSNVYITAFMCVQANNEIGARNKREITCYYIKYV